jgi:hypothetical protein
MGVRRFTELRAWRACHAYKKAVYRLCWDGLLSADWARRSQLEASVNGPPAHVAEGFGRFNPADFARFIVMAERRTKNPNLEPRTEPEHEPRAKKSEV